MAKSSLGIILSGSVWGILAKIVDAAAKFFTIPLLVAFYGKADYGLIALAFSLNAYLRLMDMGMNIGSIRFFSIWIAQNEWDKIGKVSRSSIVFYGTIGLINAVIFVLMGRFSGAYFNLTYKQNAVFEWIMYILAASTIFNWTSNVVSQLLTAHGELAWINRVTVISSILNFVSAFVSIKLNLSLSTYFFLYTLSTLVIVPLNIYRLKVYKIPVLQLLLPKWNGIAFKEILGYSVSIFAMGIFQFSADNLRPLLLGKYSSKGIGVLTEYRVLQTIALLIIAFGGVFLDVLLPSAAKMYAENDTLKISNLVFKGTKYISAFLSLIVFILIADSRILLTIYMGVGYSNLYIWLSLWLFTVLLLMHNAPVSSLVLSTGKTRILVYSSAISCLLSLPVTAILAPKFNVGAAVIGYFAYIMFQICCYYFYYIPKVLKLNSSKIFFGSFLPSALVGLMASTSVVFVQMKFAFVANFRSLIVSSVLFLVVFLGLLFLLVIKPSEIKELRQKLF
jgi:O-antigen/teichoic acid export membrane protein